MQTWKTGKAWKTGFAIAGISAAVGFGARTAMLDSVAAPLLPPTTAAAEVAPASLGGAADPNIYVSLAQKVIPSVVNISSLTHVKNHQAFRTPEDMFQEFFNGGMGQGMRQPRPDALRSASLGTGFVIDPSGIILTNHHVVDGADEIQVKFTENDSEKPIQGKVIGRDPELDIALIQIKPDHKLTALVLGDSDALKVGEFVAAVGNPFGNGHSFTHGIISAKGRMNPMSPLSTWLQTDAPINPGNSGGPLLNLKGEVVGINNAIDARAQGIGFAIPMNLVKQVLPQLQSKGSIARGYLGVGIAEVTPDLAAQMRISKDTQAPLVTQVYPGGPAYRAGIRPYDLIQEFDGKVVKSPRDLTAQVAAAREGKKVPVRISRDNKILDLSVEVGRRPEQQES